MLVGAWAWVAVFPDLIGCGVLKAKLESKTWLSSLRLMNVINRTAG